MPNGKHKHPQYALRIPATTDVVKGDFQTPPFPG